MKNTRKNKSADKPQQQWTRIDDYFSIFGAEGAGDDLWRMLKLALTADNDLSDPRQRSNMLFYFEHTKQLFADIHAVLLQREKDEKK